MLNSSTIYFLQTILFDSYHVSLIDKKRWPPGPLNVVYLKKKTATTRNSKQSKNDHHLFAAM